MSDPRSIAVVRRLPAAGAWAACLIAAAAAEVPKVPADPTPAPPAKSVVAAPAVPGTPSVSTNEPMNHFFFFKWRQKPKIVQPPPPLTLTPAAARLTDEAFSNDRRYFEELAQKLARAEHPAATPRHYTWTKAQAWLALARAEHDLDDTTGIIGDAVEQVNALVRELGESGPTPVSETPIPRSSRRIRADLWDAVTRWKQHERFVHGQEWVARLEVHLVRAGHMEHQSGWRSALSTLEEAEACADLAQAAIEGADAVSARRNAWMKADRAATGQTPSPASNAGVPKESKGLTFRPLGAWEKELRDLQNRIAALNAAGVPLNTYFLAKAQHWLDLAVSTHAANDRSGIVRDAADEAASLVAALEKRSTDISMATPILRLSRKVRADLWKLAEDLKQDPHFERCAAAVARLEIQLIWAGHEERGFGWRAAKPLIQLAEEYAAQARARLAGDAPPAQPPAAPAS